MLSTDARDENAPLVAPPPTSDDGDAPVRVVARPESDEIAEPDDAAIKAARALLDAFYEDPNGAGLALLLWATNQGDEAPMEAGTRSLMETIHQLEQVARWRPSPQPSR
jgi:hypothetical protein